MKTIGFKVKGMHCKSCEALIADELSQLQGVEDIKIDHKSGSGSLTSLNGLASADIVKAIANAGYTATVAEEPNRNGQSKNIHVIQETVSVENPIRILLELKMVPQENSVITKHLLLLIN